MLLSHYARKPWVRWMSVLVVGGILSLVALTTAAKMNPAHGIADIPAAMVGAPDDMEDLVEQADVIVVGTIGSAATETTIGPYDLEPGKQAPTFPVTDYQLTVTTVLKGADDVATGDTLALRLFGHLSKEDESPAFFNQFPMSKPDDVGVFGLAKNPDGSTYGLQFGPFSRFDLDGAAVVYSGMDGLRVDFASGVAPAQFIKNIRQEVASQGAQ